MLFIALFTVVVAAVGVALTDWRRALPICYVIGLVQDPVRKLMPQQPPYLVLVFLPVAAAILANFVASGPAWRCLWRRYPNLPIALYLLMGIGVTSSTVSLFNQRPTDASLVLMFGWLGLVLFPAAIAVGYFAARTTAELSRALAIAALISAVALFGSAFECFRGDSSLRVLGPINPRPWWHTFESNAVRMISGIFRSPEITGWQGAMLTCVSLSLFLLPQLRRRSVFWLLAAAWGMACCLLSGRRKMLAMIFVFAALLLVYFVTRKDWHRTWRLVLASVVCLVVGLTSVRILAEGTGYLELAGSTVGDIPHRLDTVAVSGLKESLDRAGWWGYGLGTATQGIQHLGLVSPMRIEGGLLRIAVEGGWIGLTGFFAVAVLLLTSCARAVALAARDTTTEVLAIGAFASVVANAACYVVGHQVFGDPFTLTLVGFLVGLLLSCGRLASAPESAATTIKQSPSDSAALAAPTEDCVGALPGRC